jgi:hypothetical protein
MTAQAGMTCLLVLDRTCWIRIEPYQSVGLPYSNAYGLATLLEVYGGHVRVGGRTLWADDIVGPLKAAVEADAGRPYIDLQLCEKPDENALLVARYVASCGYRDVVGMTVPAALRPNAAGLFVAQRWWTSDDERERAQRRVVEEVDDWAVEESAHVHDGEPPPTLTRPAITLVIETTRPEWLQHMHPGMHWGGYCFDEDAPQFP